MQCHDPRRIADSYLGDELLVETNHEVIAHLESCPSCRGELAARRDLRVKLRQAILNAPELQMRPEFAAKLRVQLQAHAERKNLFGMFNGRAVWLAAAACLVIAGAFALRVVQNRRTLTTASQKIADVRRGNSTKKESSPPFGIDTGVASRAVLFGVSETAAGDHQNCAVKFRLEQQPIDIKTAGREYDPAYIGLTNAALQGVRELADQVTFVEAHSCVFETRRFGHIILKHQGRLVSVLVTALDRSSDLSAESTESSKNVDQIVTACPSVGGYQISCFKTNSHAVFVISDIPERGNSAIARALAAPVYEHLARTERHA
ncbi:MAG: hypothetical protein H0T92_13175 [Pyrinomonadaceae bacterium]|nr:hypothetical protein [Pyrinomonadaceae bacterium]